MFSQESRREERFTIDSIVLPFVGSREEDHVCFEYLPLDISHHGLKIAIPKWLVSRERMAKDSSVNMHVPFKLNDEVFSRGKIVWAQWDDAMQAQLCGIYMEKKTPAYYPIFISIATKEIAIDLQDFSSKEDLLIRVLKDSFLLKKGVLIYLKHLVSYFSRITKYPTKEYPQLKTFLFDDIMDRVKRNQGKLESLYERMTMDVRHQKNIAVHLDLEELRSFMESEIHVDLLKITFQTDKILPYLNAVKELEKKLYYNYNTIVMIYIRSL